MPLAQGGATGDGPTGDESGERHGCVSPRRGVRSGRRDAQGRRLGGGRRHRRERRAVRFLNAGGRAAASGTLEWFATRGLDDIPMRGILPATLTTPGAVDG